MKVCKILQEHWLYDFDTFMAEIGGYVGLLLGFSFVHLLQWFNFIFDMWLLKDGNKNR